jgi:hypothetical protein
VQIPDSAKFGFLLTSLKKGTASKPIMTKPDAAILIRFF